MQSPPTLLIPGSRTPQRAWARPIKRKDSPASGDRVVAARVSAYLSGMSNITLTPSAAARVAFIASKQAKPAILRLAVEGGGCSGFQYRFGLADAVEAEDLSVETDGVTLVVDAVSLDLVRGAAVDYVEELGGAAFRVSNPNATAGCGCGSSFSV